MSTIADVARRAGVSKMTVSRVINNSGYISPDTRERVEQAIAELGYIPNALARSLRFKQTQTIALIVTDITNPFFTTIARGVEDTASEHGFSVIFCNTDESREEEQEYVRVLIQKQIDGLLLVPARSTPDSIALLQDKTIPLVLLDRTIPGRPADTVRCDSELGAYQLVRHLIELGHRRIAVLSGPDEVTTATDRVAGWRRALLEAGLPAPDDLVHYGAFTVDGGYQMARQALACTPRPTALFTANNFIAVGAMHALREAGLRVPEDISLVTFDDLPPTMAIDPFFTAAMQPAYEMGQQATLLLLNRLEGKGPETTQELILPPQFVYRRSSGPPPLEDR